MGAGEGGTHEQVTVVGRGGSVPSGTSGTQRRGRRELGYLCSSHRPEATRGSDRILQHF